MREMIEFLNFILQQILYLSIYSSKLIIYKFCFTMLKLDSTLYSIQKNIFVVISTICWSKMMYARFWGENFVLGGINLAPYDGFISSTVPTSILLLYTKMKDGRFELVSFRSNFVVQSLFKRLCIYTIQNRNTRRSRLSVYTCIQKYNFCYAMENRFKACLVHSVSDCQWNQTRILQIAFSYYLKASVLFIYYFFFEKKE